MNDLCSEEENASRQLESYENVDLWKENFCNRITNYSYIVAIFYASGESIGCGSFIFYRVFVTMTISVDCIEAASSTTYTTNI